MSESLKKEVAGADFNISSASSHSFRESFYYNSYKGVGISIGVDMSSSRLVNTTNSSQFFGKEWSLDYDNQNGIGLSGSPNFLRKIEHALKFFNYKPSLHSRQGLSNSVGIGGGEKMLNDQKRRKLNMDTRWGSTIPFNYGIYRPTLSNSITGYNFGFSFEKG